MNDLDLRDVLTRRADALDTTRPDRLTELHAHIRTVRRRRTVAVVLSGALAVAAVGTGVVATTRHERVAPAPAGPTPTPPRTIPPTATDLEPGRWAMRADGATDATVQAEVEVPSGYGGVSWFVGSDDVTLGYWVVDRVPRNPCRETGRRDPGPTVADLVTALDQQRLTTVAVQTPVTVGGYDGTYLEMTAPDIDYSSCVEGQVWYWETSTAGARHHAGPAGAVERVWILDVDGQRVVLNGDVTAGDRAALDDLGRLIDSVRFVSPGEGEQTAP